MTQSSTIPTSGAPLRVILQAGLIAGTFDILAAFTHAYLAGGATPERVLRFVASGVFGASAFTGGMWIAVAGLLFHYLIAIGWAAIFYMLYPTIRKASTNWVINGFVYGIIVWTLMNFVLVPLSNTAPHPIKFTQNTFIGLGIIMLCIGLPISWIVQRKYRERL